MSDDVEVPCASGTGWAIFVGSAREMRAAVSVLTYGRTAPIVLDLAGGRAFVQALVRILGPEVLEPPPEPGERYFRAKAKALGVPASGRADWSKMIDQAKAEHAMVEAALIAQGWKP
jgi:hypothetical protein